MRRELILILWVIAAAGGVWTLSGGGISGNFVALSGQVEERELSPENTTSRGAISEPYQHDARAGIEERLLFAAPAAPVTAVSTAVVPDVETLNLALRGIVRADDSWRAVFEGSDGQSGYLVVGLADTLAGFEIIALEADRVTLKSIADGNERTLLLRGAGEAP